MLPCVSCGSSVIAHGLVMETLEKQRYTQQTQWDHGVLDLGQME